MALTGYPTGRLRASVLRSLLAERLPLSAIKTADETVNNSNTYQDDDELFLLVEANATYYGYLQLVYSSSAVADIKVALTVPTGATATSWRWTSTASTDVAAATAGVAGIPGSATDDPFTFQGLLVVGSTAGTAQWRWAQSTAEVSNTIVRASSFFLLVRLA